MRLFFSPSSFPPARHPSTPPRHRTVKTRDVTAAHQHAVDFDPCVPVPPLSLSLTRFLSHSLSLCDAISNYIVITNALGCELSAIPLQNMGEAI